MPKKTKGNKSVSLKFRLTITRRMRKDEAVTLLKRAVRTGIVPDGIEIHYVDWLSGREGHHMNGGTIDNLEEMRAFYRVLVASDVRAARVAQA
jgi:hypothetical protein